MAKIGWRQNSAVRGSLPMVDTMQDQASGLRKIHSLRPVKTIAITGGKGGVGKTSIAINLGTAFSQLGRASMLLDADLGLANVDVLLGLRTPFNLEHVIAGECALSDIIVTAPSGLRVVPASSGSLEMATLSAVQHAGVVGAFSELFDPIDVLLVDTAAGISEGVLAYSGASRHIVVAVCDDPASLTDAYGLIKVLRKRHRNCQVEIIANMVDSLAQGRSLFDKLARVTNRFLNFAPRYLGAIPYDEYLKRSVQQQRAVVECYPWSASARAFKRLALAADNWGTPPQACGGVEFFVERMLQSKLPQAQTGLQ
jgi:flagellar biosynthesis protein FlhG